MSAGISDRRTRGQPLIAMLLLLVCWTGLRVATIGPLGGLLSVTEGKHAPARLMPDRNPRFIQARAQGGSALGEHRAPFRGAQEEEAMPPPIGVSPVPKRPAGPLPVLAAPVGPVQPERAARRTVHAASHNLMWMAAMGAMPLPAPIADALHAASQPATGGGSQAFAFDPLARPPRQRRWSGDGWLALRGGKGALAAPLSAGPSYGASQAGAVLRYRLAPHSAHAPHAYLRAVTAFASPRQQDLAAGLSVRPTDKLPIAVAGEMRVSQRGQSTTLRPAAFVTTGVEDKALGAGFRLRGYGQAGYVGGKQATAFLDASLVTERPLARVGPHETFVGAGAWAGAQRGAARLDIGPSASLKLQLGPASGRLAVDYRLRVAGNAAPASGAALTLSAGF